MPSPAEATWLSTHDRVRLRRALLLILTELEQ
jgi:hypothetical protein